MFGSLGNYASENVLRNQLIGHLACHTNNSIYVVPVSYAYNDGFIYVHSEEGIKIKMMRQNPHVCFEVYNMENMANWQSVICWGTYEELTDEEARTAALGILLKRSLPMVTSKTVELTTEWPFVPVNLNEIPGVVFRIKIKRKSGRYERMGFTNH